MLSLQSSLKKAADDIRARAIPAHPGAISRSSWVQRHISLAGKPFSFAGHEYLRGLYDCDHPHIVIEKAAQVGGSLFAILDTLWAIDSSLITTAVYFFPTTHDVRDFSQDRIRPIIKSCPHLAARTSGIDNSGYTQFIDLATRLPQSSIYFRGMKSSVSTASVPADQIVIDERDKVSEREYSLAIKRISHSSTGLIRELCTPTIPDYGIDAAFLRSDMRFWTIKCPACGNWNQPEKTFRDDQSPERVIYLKDSRAYLGCSLCASPLDPSRGEWVADFPSRTAIAGFHLSQLYSTVTQSGRPIQHALLDEFHHSRHIADYWNSRIGFPFEDASTSLPLETLNSCDGDYPMQPTGQSCVMGIDQGNHLHIVISRITTDTRQIIYAGIHTSFDDLPPLMRAYDIRTCVIDALPDLHSARKFAESFPDRVFLCYYNSRSDSPVKWHTHNHSVHVNRTEILDSALAEYTTRRVRLPRHPIIDDTFKKQMTAMARRPLRSESGEVSGYEWVRRGPDHFRHADAYNLIASLRAPRLFDDILSGIITASPRQSVSPHPSPDTSTDEIFTSSPRLAPHDW